MKKINKKTPVIFYSFSGEGRGHASTAIALREELLKTIPTVKIIFFCGGKGYDFLVKANINAIEIPYLKFEFTHGKVNTAKTLISNLKTLLFEKRKAINTIEKLVQKYNPDIFICDFEFFLPIVSKIRNIPLINLSHQLLIISSSIYPGYKNFFDYLASYLSIKIITSKHSIKDIAISFFTPKIKKTSTKTEIIGPIIRREILSYINKTKKNNFILVYLMDDSFNWVIDILRKFSNEKFVVLGCNNIKTNSNIEIKNINPNTFSKWLAECKAVIATAGHTLISEALILKKPIFLIVQENQFEQYLNAYHLEKINFGTSVHKKKYFEKKLEYFLSNLHSFEKNIKTNFEIGNSKAVEIIAHYVKKSMEMRGFEPPA